MEAQELLVLQLEHFEPMGDPTTNIVNVATSGVLDHLNYNAGAVFHLVQDPLTFLPAEGLERTPQRLIGDQVKAEIVGALGLFNLINVEFAVPMILSQEEGEDLAPLGRPGVVTEGFELVDPRITTKIRLMDRKYVGGLGLGVTVPVYIPLGDEEQLNSQGFRVEPRVLFDWQSDSGITGAVNIDYELRRWGLAASSPLFFVEGLGAYGLLFGNFPVGQNLLGALVSPNQAFSTNPVEGMLGLSYRTPFDVTVGLGVGQGLTGGIGAAGLRGMLQISYTPPPDPDGDLDDNVDSTDLCPSESEDFDGFQDSDGCPELDNDEDGIADDDDGCPLKAEDLDGFEDENGCPDVDSEDPNYDPDPIEFSLTANVAAPTLDLGAVTGGAAANGPPQRPRASPSPNKLYSVEGAQVLGHLDTGTELQLEPVRVPDSGDQPFIDQAGLMNTNLFAIGLFGFMEVSADAPIFFSRQDPTAVGDVRASVKGMVINPENRNIGLAFSLPVVAPVQDSAFSNDSLEIGPTAILEVDTSPIRTKLNFAGLYLNNVRDDAVEDIGRLRYGVAGEYGFLSGRLDLGLEFTGERDFQNFLSSQKDAAFGVVLGVRFETLAGTIITFGGNFSQGPDQLLPEIGGFGNVKYTTVVSDFDGDGLGDEDDQCKTAAEDFDQFEDLDGCPESDNDGDGINDVLDLCPMEPEDKDGSQDSDGCPDFDMDGDGLDDSADKCPNLPGPPSNEGCPDADKDGILEVDKCPDAAEDLDGFNDEDGCPEPDNDIDNIPDGLDRCPNVAGVTQWQGCNDVVVQVLFDYKTADIKVSSHQTLDEMAEIIKTNPIFQKVEVQGHTDDLGDDEQNLALSQRRAEAVREYVISKGVSAERLTARGYGETLPAVPIEGVRGNKLNRARESNRRVVFKLLDAGSEGDKPAPRP